MNEEQEKGLSKPPNLDGAFAGVKSAVGVAVRSGDIEDAQPDKTVDRSWAEWILSARGASGLLFSPVLLWGQDDLAGEAAGLMYRIRLLQAVSSGGFGE